MKIKSLEVERILLFTLGLFSTFQLTEVFGMTIFTVLLFASTIFMLLKYRKIRKYRLEEGAFIAVASISEIIMLLSTQIDTWVKTSIKTYIILITVFVLYGLLKNVSTNNVRLFVKGVYFSCVVQLIWCIAQLLINKLWNININQIIFNDFLNIKEQVTQYKQGRMIVTGLNSNAGMLVPIFITGMMLSKNKFVKVLFIVFSFLVGSATPIIAVCTYIFVTLLFRIKDVGKVKLREDVIYKFVLGIVFVIVGIIFIFNSGMVDNIYSSVSHLCIRISSIFDGNVTDASTFAHLRYYTALPYIYSKIDILKMFFGYGVKRAGIPYIEYLNQYPDLIWVPESDFVTYVFNVGIIGMISFYCLIFRNIYKGYKIDKKYAIFHITIVIVGLFYGVQLNWVLLIELLFFEMISRNCSIEILITK